MQDKKTTAAQKPFQRRLHLPLIIFLVCLLATFKIWDYYFNSSDLLDRMWVSVLILLMGTLFSAATGFLIWTLESGKNYLEREIKRRTEELIEKERQAAAAEAKSLEAHRKREEIEEAYRRLQELQAQLIQSEKLASVGRVVAGIIHELNAPLVTMQGYTNMLMKGVVREDGKSSAELIHRQAERCQKIVSGLLTFSRREKIHLQEVDLGGLIDRVLEEMPPEFKSDGVAVVKQYPGEKVIIEADPDQLEKLFINILVNDWQALKEVPAGQRQITIHLSSAENAAQLFFTDTGPGIPKENLQKIFEPFFTTKPAGQGTGLGLSLCHGIVGMHGGQIQVQSEEGKGTAFLIELPHHPLQQNISSKGPKKKILVVDDDPSVLEFLKTLLHGWGHETVAVESGQEALEVISKTSRAMDLILLDIHMPGMSGFEMAERLRQDPRFSAVPIIFLTARAAEEDAARTQALAAREYLSKPFDYKDLQKTISKIFTANSSAAPSDKLF